MPRTPRQNQQLRAESRRRLLDAARTTFTRLGFERATVRDIAREAGVAQGLLYHHFRDKDDLLRAVFLEGTRDVGRTRLTEVSSNFFAMFGGEPLVGRGFLGTEQCHRRGPD